MAYIYSKLKIKDFAGWKKQFESIKTKRHEAGIAEKYVLRGLDDRNEVLLLLK